MTDESPPARPLDPADEPPRTTDPATGLRTDGGTATAPEESGTEVDPDEILEGIERKRSLAGVAAVVTTLVAVAFSAFQMWIAARGFEFTVSLPLLGEVDLGALQLLQVNAVHVAFALTMAFLLFPPTTGDGFVSGRFAQVVPALERRLGRNHAATQAADGVRSLVRWFMVDPGRERVTPADAVTITFAALTALYMVTEFPEVQRLRVLGMQSGRPVTEVYGFLAPLATTPLGEVSYAFLLGVVGVLLVLEATRRTLGIYLMLIVSSFIVYARFGYLIPPDAPLVGVLSIGPGRWPNIIQNLWYNTENGVFGIPVTVSVAFIYIFILFGAFLEMSGAGQWFIDLAYSATGTRKGGPAKASILASGFMGTISGSSIANTVTTGAFTIPLMKRSGYRAEFAGAVEASASSGGQILPPVMGAAAFLMIEYLGIPFADIITAAAIPAVVFFFGVWVMVHLEASRVDIGGLDPSEVVRLRDHLTHGWFYLAPVLLLLFYLIVERLSVARSAWFTLVAIMALMALVSAYNRQTRVPLIGVITALFLATYVTHLAAGVGLVAFATGAGGAGLPPVAAFFAAAGGLGTIVIAVSVATLLVRPRLEAPLLDFDDQVDAAAALVAGKLNRPRLTDLGLYNYGTFVLKSMDAGARTSTEVVVAVAAAGIIPGVVSATGLGPNLTALIKAVAAGSIVLLLLFTAVASIILGMGMPTTVTYIILVSLLAPAIAQTSDIPLLAAHLFILYFGVIADITPPVAVAAYAASGIARSDPFRTGVEAFSLSLNKAIVPFAFALTPGILLLRGRGAEAHVISFADVLDPLWFLPEVLVPVAGVFVGVVALGATVIGFLYAPASRSERALFAVSAFLLMAPLLLLNAAGDLSSLVGLGFSVRDPLLVDLTLRAFGGVLFAALALKNRREAGDRAEAVSTPGVAD